MAKDKTKGGSVNRHLYARTAFLQKAATHLASSGSGIAGQAPRETDTTAHISADDGAQLSNKVGAPVRIGIPPYQVLPIHMNTHLQQVARKSQIRLKRDVKHSICKRCHSVISAQDGSSRHTENLSKGRAKPHADVLVITCKACSATKRFPVGAERQKRKWRRAGKAEGQASETGLVLGHDASEKPAPDSHAPE